MFFLEEEREALTEPVDKGLGDNVVELDVFVEKKEVKGEENEKTLIKKQLIPKEILQKTRRKLSLES